MAITTIEWTATRNANGTVTPGYTHNPWLGCTAVSAACKNCYAQTLVETRFGKAKWGKGEARVRTSEANRKKPLAWNRQAAASSTRPKVFCASLADVFDAEVDPQWRDDLWELVALTPHLDWLLLTKRPQFIGDMIPWADGQAHNSWKADVSMWPNVWLGTTVEDQETADERIPHLLNVPAYVRFLSMEPLLGAVDLTSLQCGELFDCEGAPYYHSLKGFSFWGDGDNGHKGPGISWVITGGESGSNARPSHPDWFRDLRDQCEAAKVEYHFKQHGEWLHESQFATEPNKANIEFWNRYPQHLWPDGTMSYRVGKKHAGRVLDGREHNGVPNAAVAQ